MTSNAKNNRNVRYMTMRLFFRPLNQSCLHSGGDSSSFDPISLSSTPVITWIIVKALFFRANMSVYIIDSHVVTGSIGALNLVSTFPDLVNWRSTHAPIAVTTRISRTIIARWGYVILAHVRQIFCALQPIEPAKPAEPSLNLLEPSLIIPSRAGSARFAKPGAYSRLILIFVTITISTGLLDIHFFYVKSIPDVVIGLDSPSTGIEILESHGVRVKRVPTIDPPPGTVDLSRINPRYRDQFTKLHVCGIWPNTIGSPISMRIH